MKRKLPVLLYLIFISANSIYSQVLFWDKEKDRKVRKIDKQVEGINQDTSIIRFEFNDSLITSKTNIPNRLRSTEEVKSQRRKPPISLNSYYLKDSLIVKIVFDGSVFYLVNEKLIMSKKTYQGSSDNTTQCCPITIYDFQYYWKNTLYENIEARNSNCSYPCGLTIKSQISQNTVGLLLKRIKKIND
jgi:hypothetical protein